MKKPMYWKYIVIALMAFIVVFHIGAIIYIQEGTNFELTSRDYYQKGQVYEQEIQAMNRGNGFSWEFNVNQPGKIVVTLVPNSGDTVFSSMVKTMTLDLMRINDSNLDTSLTLTRQGDTLVFSGDAHLKKGLWRMAASFEESHQSYLLKKDLFVP